MLMLYAEPAFTSYTGVAVTDLSESREVINKAIAAGATPIGDAQESDGVHMRAFRDLDGHWCR